MSWSLIRLGSLWVVLWPANAATMKLVGVFTMILPKWWYMALKAIHKRGAAWPFAVEGFLCLLIATDIQVVAIIAA
jgi:hypothetical protein